MAETKFADVGPQVPEIWSAELFTQAEDLTFFGQFEGPQGSGMPIIRKDQLEKEPGDTIRVDLVLSLVGAGIEGDTATLEGNEEELKFNQMTIGVEQLSHAVRWSKKTAALITHNMRQTGLNQLSRWLAGRLDDDVFDEFTSTTANPAGNLWFAGNATTRDTLDSADTLKLADISDIKAFAQSDKRIEPLRMEGGEEYFGLVVHPYANLSLKKDADYQQAEREAGIRGRDNPLFTGATFLWDGVIGYVSNRVPRSLNAAGTPIQVADNVFFGAQALSRAYAYYPDWVEQEFDYGRSIGIATSLIKGEALNVFDLSQAQDGSDNVAIGSLVLYTAAVAPTA